MSNKAYSDLRITNPANPLTGTELVMLTQVVSSLNTSVIGLVSDFGTFAKNMAINPQTGTTYTYVNGDNGKFVTHSNASAIAGTLPQAGASFPAGWWTDVKNIGAGTLTITPTTSTIDNAASLVLTTGQGVTLLSDGANYFTLGQEKYIVPGTTAQYWRGDKTWSNLAADVLALAALRGAGSVSSVAGVVTIDLASGNQVFNLTLTENVTSWTFSNTPASGKVSEIRIVIKQGASTAYTCVSPATSGNTAGGAWVISSALNATESLGIAVDSAGTRAVFPSGVYA